MILWFASGNVHKREELAAILGGACEIKIPSDKGMEFNPEETGADFAQNAMIKARALFDMVREPVIADDSGLCADALGGGPGIYSARFGSEGGVILDAAKRNALLLSKLEGVKNRRARFVCAMVLMLGENRFYMAQETLEGRIIESSRGEGGFGYDPLLYIDEYKKTVAELSSSEKNKISHRAKAALSLRGFIVNAQA